MHIFHATMSDGSVGKETTCNAGGTGHPEVRHEGREPLLDKAGESTFLP